MFFKRKKRWKEDSPKFLKTLAERFEKLENPTKEDFERALKSLAEELEVGLGKLIHPARLAVSGTGAGPGLFDILFIKTSSAKISSFDQNPEKKPDTDDCRDRRENQYEPIEYQSVHFTLLLSDFPPRK